MQDGSSSGVALDGPSLVAVWTRRLPASRWTGHLPRPPGRRFPQPARQELGHHSGAFYFHRATDDFYTIGQQPPYVSHRNHAETAQP